jgi:hypothetical protein
MYSIFTPVSKVYVNKGASTDCHHIQESTTEKKNTPLVLPIQG